MKTHCQRERHRVVEKDIKREKDRERKGEKERKIGEWEI